MSQQAGWHHDPYGRFQQRYWDGAKWTEHVATGGVQQVDPMGSSTVIPFATPATAQQPPANTVQGLAGNVTAAPAALVADGDPAPAAANGLRTFLDSFGADAHRRPEPVSSISIAGIGGFVASFGLLLLIIGNDVNRVDDVRGKLFVSSLITLGGALAVRFLVQHQHQLRSAAVGAGAPALVGLGGAITWKNTGDAWALLVIALMLLAAWALPGFRGRPLMLALGALFVVAAIGRATASGSTRDGAVPRGVTDVIGGQGAIFLLMGMLLLGGVYLLDREGYAGVATSLVTAAIISSWVGVGQTVPKLDDTPGSLLVIATGLVIGVVGTHGARRATSWIGALITGIGTVSFMYSLMQPFKNSSDVGIMLLLSGALLVGGAVAAAAIIRSRKAAAEAAPPPPVPTAGSLQPPQG